MIYFLVGEDLNKKKEHFLKILGENIPFPVGEESFSENSLLEKATTNDLFGGVLFFVLEDFLSKKIDLSKESLVALSESRNVFIFKEDKILAGDKTKYSKYAKILDCSTKTKSTQIKFNVFSICDAFARRDKIGAWILYNKAVMSGLSSEEISGALFWKIKMIAETGSRFFTDEEIKNMSSSLVSLYHESHLGKKDFQIGLEQFILNNLEK